MTVLKLAHGLDVEHPVHKAMAFMAEEVARQSGGRMRVDLYPSEQLGSERECLELVQLGILTMTKSSSAPMEGFVPAMKVFGLPYLFRDSSHMWKVFKGAIGREILAAGASRGLQGLCFYDAGARSFYTTQKPVRHPGDLKGMKIRVMKSEMAMRMIEAMGGSPTPIDWGELYTALQQGVVDGAENNSPTLFVSRQYEICRHYTLDEHLRQPDVLVINPDVWKALDDEKREILLDAVEASVEYQRELWKRTEVQSLERVREAGVEIIHPDKKPFLEAVKSVWARFDGTEIGDLARRIQAVE